MKTITKERILKALENSSRYCHNKPETHIVRTLAHIGMRTACANAFGQDTEITEKERLELAYQGFTDPEKIFRRLSHWNASRSLDSISAIKEAWLSSWDRVLKQKWNRDKKILDIQRKHKISGLDECEINFGEFTVQYHEPSYELDLLPSDYEVMESERMLLAEGFVSAFRYHEMKLYRRTNDTDINKQDDWIPATPDLVLELAETYQWANVWENKSYVNHHELEAKGYTAPLSYPATPQHEFEWEFNLTIGNGKPDSSRDSTWFCARLGKGEPAL
jgi:hypothetical protein